MDRYRIEADRLERADAGYPEAQARLDYIDKFLIILGWDVHNDEGKPQHRRDVVVEKPNSKESTGGASRPDYRLRPDGVDRLTVEAKKPSVNLSSSGDASVQARSYGWSLGLPAAALTNFAETVIFDAEIEPEVGDGPEVAVRPGGRFSVGDYIDRFDELWDLLSYESLASDRFDEVYEYTAPPRGQSAFDRSFLEQFRKLRKMAAQAIADGNPSLGAAEVGRRTQRLLNALLFLRVCEDRDLDKYERLVEAADSNELKALFQQSDRTFNAGLFTVLNDTRIDPQILARIVHELYWPRSKFAFGILQPDTLAAVYEQFLAERVELDGARQVSLVQKPEVVHAGGVVPTPQFVVDALLDGSLAPKVVPQWGAEQPKFLGPACGSGVFEVSALRRIVEILENAGHVVDLAERARIAKSSIFAVDIDPEAVEVTRLSLLLTILGEEDIDITVTRSLLPDLSSNIVCGNFIVGTDFDALLPSVAAIAARRATVAPFDPIAAFAGVFSLGGFDVIAANPPYVRIQVLAEIFPDQLAYFQDPRSGFVSAQSYNFDEYMLFIEKAIGLLAMGGQLAFIVPNRITNALASASIRKQIGPRLNRLVHFGELQVFPDRTTYTALLFIGDPTTDPATLELVHSLNGFESGVAGEVMSVDRSELGEHPWPVATQADKAVFDKMEAAAIGSTLR